MKNTVASASASATAVAKQIVSLLRSMARAKSVAIKSKTDAIRARLEVFSLLRNKKLSLVAVSRKIHSLLPGGGHQEKIKTDEDWATSNLQLQCCSSSSSHQLQLQVPKDDEVLDSCSINPYYNQPDYHDEDPYPDLTHSLFDEADAYDNELDQLVLKGDPNASVIDLVKNSKEHCGENFSLEAEIDHVADLYIMTFHKKMRMQKLESFKRYQEMLERSV